MNKNLNKIKKLKTFKIILLIVIIAFLFILIPSCKEAPAVEEQGQETVPSETKETAPQTTQKETLPVVEETPEEIEWEGITFSPIEGLRFDKGTFYFLDNEYGGEVGEKAGVLIPRDAVEVDGISQGAFGFDPRVIEVMQKKIMEKDKEFKYPLPFNLEEAKGIKIKEVESHEADQTPEEDRILDNKDTYITVSNVPLGTIIYSPSSTLTSWWEDMVGDFGGFYVLRSNIIPGLFKEGIVDDHKLDHGTIFIRYNPKGAEFISKEIEERFSEQQKIWESDLFAEPFEIEIKMGTPLVKITDKVNLKEVVREENPGEEDPVCRWTVVSLKEADYQMRIGYIFRSEDKRGTTGLRNLLEIGGMKIFILPANEI